MLGPGGKVVGGRAGRIDRVVAGPHRRLPVQTPVTGRRCRGLAQATHRKMDEMSMKPSEMDPRPGTATRSTLTRRRLLNALAPSGVAVAGGVALAAGKDPTLAAAAVPYAAGGPDESKETLSGINPTRALHELLAGNKRFAAGCMLHPRLSVQRRAQV